MKSILGKKVGMTQIFLEDGELIPVTVVEAKPMVVTQIKTKEKEGYDAIQVGYGELKQKHSNKAKDGHFAKANVELKKYLREIKIDENDKYEVGQEILINIFAEKDKIDITGISKGKGTQGSIVRHNYSRGPQSHGSKSHRVSGARSAGTFPGRVLKGTKASGKMGHDRVTVQNLEVAKIIEDKNLILIKGAIPGNKGGLVIIKETVKKK